MFNNIKYRIIEMWKKGMVYLFEKNYISKEIIKFIYKKHKFFLWIFFFILLIGAYIKKEYMNVVIMYIFTIYIYNKLDNKLNETKNVFYLNLLLLYYIIGIFIFFFSYICMNYIMEWVIYIILY